MASAGHRILNNVSMDQLEEEIRGIPMTTDEHGASARVLELPAPLPHKVDMFLEGMANVFEDTAGKLRGKAVMLRKIADSFDQRATRLETTGPENVHTVIEQWVKYERDSMALINELQFVEPKG